MPIDHVQLEATLQAACGRLLAARNTQGHWVGTLSSSALSTATAACALELLARSSADRGDIPGADLKDRVRDALNWIAQHQNADGGWGDTIDSSSNISTTTLCWAALGVNPDHRSKHRDSNRRAETWLTRRAGDLSPKTLAGAIERVYGRDRTFAIPILTMCALSGRFGPGAQAWRFVHSLPFELAACPRSWFARLGLPVVSYALPALIAIGQARHYHRPSANPIARALRHLLCERTLGILQDIQPPGGGFLEAAPLTSFVVMSLASIDRSDHAVVQRGASFLVQTVRDDGSWPIDTNLATWVTTLGINALAGGGQLDVHLPSPDRARLRGWLLDQQFKTLHSYTQAAPGGWAWTDRSGGVPDADDTAGALLALRRLIEGHDESLFRGVAHGVKWLLDVQNKDGGLPTFCRGWGALPFDRSTPDLTAHALRAWHAWRADLPAALQARIDSATALALGYLTQAQQSNGAWMPLWFGNQRADRQQNPLYGTTRVLRALVDLPDCDAMCQDGLAWLLSAQHPDGGWGGDVSVAPSIEETALALEALTALAGKRSDATVMEAIEKGAAWLMQATHGGTQFQPVPIGLYFAKLWYHERLYPLIFTVSALEGVRSLYAKAQPQNPLPQRADAL